MNKCSTMALKWVMMCVGMLLFSGGGAFAQFAGGSGTSDDPYLIQSVIQLDSLRAYPNACFRQISDIDLNDYPDPTGDGWVPLCSFSSPFTGSYDGNGMRILNLSSSAMHNVRGLFAVIDGAEIRNLELNDFQINNGNSLGGLAGVARNSLVTGIRAYGTIFGNDIVGGIAGEIQNCVVSDCELDFFLYAHEAGGGVGGWVTSSQISNCSVSFSYGYMYYNFGGIVGYAVNTHISSCTVSGEMFGGSKSGGIVAEMIGGTVTNCHTLGGALQAGGPVGGIVGEAFGTGIADCSSSLFIRGHSQTGGAVGFMNAGASMSRCSAWGDVEGRGKTGGLIGTLTNSYAIDSFSRGNISADHWSGTQSAGGFVGTISGTNYGIMNCYSTGLVTSTGVFTGGFSGEGSSASVHSSYWDMETSGWATSFSGLGRTTAQMTWPYDQDTYQGWNFSGIWHHDLQYGQGGYPLLLYSGVDISDPHTPPAQPKRIDVAPNPFREHTEISFDLPRRGLLQVEIFDLRGRKVRTLIDGTSAAGKHTSVWDGRNDDGKKLASGVYLVRVIYGAVTSIRRLTLLK